MTAFDLSTFRFNPIRSQLETVLDVRLVNVCMKECELIKGGHTFGLLAVIDRLRNDSAAVNESGIATLFFAFHPPPPNQEAWSQARTEGTEATLGA